jgi:hypothetical protein
LCFDRNLPHLIDGSTAHGDGRRELQALLFIAAVACAWELQLKVAS